MTSTNDYATGYWFPIGRWFSTRLESVRRHTVAWGNGEITPPADAEGKAILHTMGHLPWLITHRLSCVKTEGSAHRPYKGWGVIGLIGTKSDRPSMNLIKRFALMDISKRIGSAPTAVAQFWNTSVVTRTIHSGQFKRRPRSWTATTGSSDQFSWISYVRFVMIGFSPSLVTSLQFESNNFAPEFITAITAGHVAGLPTGIKTSVG